jgi:hypothetical protein
MDITTIKLNKKTKERLDKLKIHNRESYDEVIQEVLKILNLCKVNPFQAKAKLQEIDKIRVSFEKKNKENKKVKVESEAKT